MVGPLFNRAQIIKRINSGAARPSHLHVVHAIHARQRGLQLVDNQAAVAQQPPQLGRALAILRLVPGPWACQAALQGL